MEVAEKHLNGLLILKLKSSIDLRGGFFKPFNKTEFMKVGLPQVFDECFYTISHKGVLRGMHFQLPPYDHDKIVYCSHGSVLDVILDIRKGSPTYGHFFEIELLGEDDVALFIPKGYAHGFYSRSAASIINYMVTSEHSPANDTGVRWDSFGFDWPEPPTVSKRDEEFCCIDDFESPFFYGE